MPKEVRDGFTSRWGFILAAMGAAIGTGNIWRFPREAAQNGGGAFMIAWLCALFMWSIPVLIAEYSIGKHTRKGVIGSFRIFMGKKYIILGVWMVWVQAAIMFYYSVVMGWTMRYSAVALTGQFTPDNTEAIWQALVSSPGEMVGWQVLAIAVSAVIVMRGIKGGIELANRILIPMLIFLLIIAMLWSLTLPGAIQGLRYLYVPDPAYLMKGETWIRAVSHSAWSCSAGMGMGITYASYMRKREDTTANAFLTGLGNNSVELISGVAVLCTLFALSPTVSAANQAIASGGSGLTFIYLPALFVTMPGGPLIALMFFTAMAFAALTSMISGIEIIVRNFIDVGWSRKRATFYVIAAIFIGGVPSAFSLALLDNQDYVWGVGLIVSGLFVSLLVLRYGVSRFRRELINTGDNDLYVGMWWERIMRYVVPTLAVVLLGWYLMQSYLEDPESWWNPFQTRSVGTLIFQWTAISLLFLYMRPRVNRLYSGLPEYPSAKDYPVLIRFLKWLLHALNLLRGIR